MKTLFACIISLLLSAQAISQELTVGDKLPAVDVDNCILPGSPNMVVKNISLQNFAGKIIILDFWATWCGPCISSIPKYEKFQKKYPDQLQVIGVTHETVKRIQTFLRNRPVSFMLAVDTASTLRTYFEYRTIPHVVIIDGTGTVKAITHSDQVTDAVMEDLVNGRDVSLPLKKDNVGFNPEKDDHFNAPVDTRESFNIQPTFTGVGTLSMVGTGIFAKRRVSMINFTIDGLYRMAYQVSYYRTVLEVDEKLFEYKNPKNKYCVDVIVPEAGDGLYTYMKQQLPKHFDIKARIEKKKVPVTVLKRTQGPLTLEPSTEQNDYFGASGNHFTGNGVQVSALAKFLEDFGVADMPVLDETNVTGRYNILLEWQPEKKGHMEEVFRNAGFELMQEEREIDVIVLYR
jgi:uncharacterized protein (TIGR03435 family)